MMPSGSETRCCWIVTSSARSTKRGGNDERRDTGEVDGRGTSAIGRDFWNALGARRSKARGCLGRTTERPCCPRRPRNRLTSAGAIGLRGSHAGTLPSLAPVEREGGIADVHGSSRTSDARHDVSNGTRAAHVRGHSTHRRTAVLSRVRKRHYAPVAPAQTARRSSGLPEGRSVDR